MTEDIVDRLRKEGDFIGDGFDSDILQEAANEIERLRRIIACCVDPSDISDEWTTTVMECVRWFQGENNG